MLSSDACSAFAPKEARGDVGPTTQDGHIFFIWREYEGPRRVVLQVSAGNIPRHTTWDARLPWNGNLVRCSLVARTAAAV